MTEPASIEQENSANPDDEKVVITKGKIARAGIKFVATSSVRFAVSGAIATLVPAETTKEKRKVFIASMVLSGIINEKVKDYVDEEINDKMEYVHLVVAKVREMEALRNADAQDATPTTEQ